jgi:hypothetical protein
VANKHYLQIREEDFRRAAKCGAGALQKPVQQGAASPRTDPQESAEGKAVCEVVREGASSCDAGEYAWQDSNLQPSVP